MSVNLNRSLTNLERAGAAWGDALPAWVRALALECDRAGQRATSERVGFASQPELGRIIRRQHTGSYDNAERLVVTALGLGEYGDAERLVTAALGPFEPLAPPATTSDPTTNLAKALVAWGPELPRWVRLLAEASDASSQTMAAARLVKSSTWVSRIINHAYAGSYSEAEEQVLARLGGEEVACPIWANVSPIPLISCIRTRRAKSHSGPMMEWAKHCLTCPLNTDLQETRS